MYGEDDGGFFRREMAYQEHQRHADSRGHHIDGCFYCGGSHPSDCCPDSSAMDEYWEPGTPDMEIDE